MERNAPRTVSVLRVTNVAISTGNNNLQARVACQGFKKLKGRLHFSAATPTAGYPRVIQYGDSATRISKIDVLSQDASQPDVNFPIDIDLDCPYVAIEYNEAGGGGTLYAGLAELQGV